MPATATIHPFPVGPATPFPAHRSVDLPAPQPVKLRNIALDCFFYDVAGLTGAEIRALVRETHSEGAVLVVYPRGAKGDMGVVKHADYHRLRAAPGALLNRFAIAGVGSSDLGAAALARTLADHCGAPVGAIVAGYGVTDVVAEALGGWFVLGAANRLRRFLALFDARLGDALDRLGTSTPLDRERAARAGWHVGASPDTETLLHLLLDEDREIVTLLGHSKGCLSIAAALHALGEFTAPAAHEKARRLQVVTAGAVVSLPGDNANNAAQYLGTLDGLGLANSRPWLPRTWVPGAGHPVNTLLPLHLDLAAALRRAGG